MTGSGGFVNFFAGGPSHRFPSPFFPFSPLPILTSLPFPLSPLRKTQLGAVGSTEHGYSNLVCNGQ